VSGYNTTKTLNYTMSSNLRNRTNSQTQINKKQTIQHNDEPKVHSKPHLPAQVNKIVQQVQSDIKKMSTRRRIACLVVFFALTVVVLGILVIANFEVISSAVDQTGGPSALSSTFAQVYESEWYRKLIKNDRLTPAEILSTKYESKVHYPVIMLPGIVSTGLEVWKARPCARRHFRERMWGTTVMLQNMLLQPKCWVDHVSLDYNTGLDPEGIKLRPAGGMEAADYLVGGYWVWAKLIRELAVVGYDTNSMFMASYDWRLALPDLEKRDHYYSKLKATIEVAKISNHGRKSVLVSHSWGSNMVLYFLKWAEANAYEGWVNDHIHAVMNVAGPLLGVPKSLTSLLSGEMRDTAELSPPLLFLKNQVLSTRDTTRLFRSWGSISHMLPKGGARLWGSLTEAADDVPGTPSFGAMMKFTDNRNLTDLEEPKKEYVNVTCEEKPLEPVLSVKYQNFLRRKNHTVTDSLDVLRHIAPKVMSRIDSMYSFGFASKLDGIETLQSSEFNQPKFWSNPLESSLPVAPEMKMYCLYGVGKLAERAYYYHRSPPPGVFLGEPVGHNDTDASCQEFPYSIDTSIHDPELNISKGVQQSDGDGTVPLLSLGFMCRRAWKSALFNPSMMQVVTREYADRPPVSIIERGESIFRESGNAVRFLELSSFFCLTEFISFSG
jgi:phospholipid:diacylglycerol acyltransferase